jgi:hypothetical protein
MGAVLMRLAREREKLEGVLAGVSDVVALERRLEDPWTLAEHANHLLVVETGVLQICRSVVERAEDAGAPPAMPRRSTDDPAIEYGELLMPYLRFADHTWQTLPALMPRDGALLSDTLPELRAIRGALAAVCAYGAAYDLREFRHVHYYLGEEIDIYTYLFIHAEHEARHRRKIKTQLAEEWRRRGIDSL